MKKIKKVLGLIAVLGLCILGLASCNGKVKVTGSIYFEERNKEGYIDTGYKKVQLSGKLYQYIRDKKHYISFILIGDDGIIYTAKHENKKSTEVLFTKSKYQKITDNVLVYDVYADSTYIIYDDCIIGLKGGSIFERIYSLEEAVNDFIQK